MITKPKPRLKLYQAEDVMAPLGTAMTLPEMQALVDKVLASTYVRKHFPGINDRFKIEVINGRGYRGMARTRRINWIATEMVIIMPDRPAIRLDWYLLHEIAHHLTDYGHGWQFCDAYLRLVRHFMSEEAYRTLKASMKAHRVRYKRPVVRPPLTDEQRAAATARLAAYRALKQKGEAA